MNESKIKGIKSIKVKLIIIIIPLVILATTILLMMTYSKSKKIIVGYANQLVSSLTDSNTHEIETWTNEITSELDQVKNTIEHIALTEIELLNYLKTTMNRNDSYKNGVYIGLKIIKC